MADQILQLDHSQSAGTNLMVARRADREVTGIVASASYACIYSFDKQWSKCPFDGPLFLVSRSSQPYLKLLLLNRQSTSNWTHSIELGVSCGADVSSQMLSIRDRDGTVSGCWFHDASELTAMSKCIREHLKALKTAQASPSAQPQVAATPPPTVAPAPHATHGQGVMGLLHSAQAQAQPSSTPSKPSYSAAVSTPSESTGANGLHDLLNSAAAAASEQVAAAAGGGGGSGTTVTPLALSKEALREVMMDMLQEPAFMDELHARFIARLQEVRGTGAPGGGGPPHSAKKRKPRGGKKKGGGAQ